MDKVSFTGISNTVAEVVGQVKPQGLKLRVDLNDEGSKDLSQFKAILQKFPNHSGKDSITIHRTINPDDMSKVFMLNEKTVKMDDSNIPIFQKIAELTRKIINYDETLPMDENSLQKSIKELMTSGAPKSGKRAEMMALGLHDNLVKDVASNINSDLDEIMKDYFA